MNQQPDRDYVELNQYHVIDLCFKLGYSIFCRVEGIDVDLVVRDVRMIGDDGYNYEVRVLEGWRKPVRCWGIGPTEGMKVDSQPVEQKGLFG